MNPSNIYEGLQVEPFKVNMIEQIHLRARIVDPIHFVFVPETWEQALKPYKKANWTHDTHIYSGGVKVKNLHNYTLKQGVFLAFPQFHMTNGGFYAAHLYAVVSNMFCDQVKATLTVEGLTLEAVGDRQTVHLKPRGLSVNDTPYHAILSLD